MSELHLPWTEISIGLPLLGALLVNRQGNAQQAQRWCVVFSALTLLCVLAQWLDFALSGSDSATGSPGFMISGQPVWTIDLINAPVLVLGSLISLLTAFTTQRTKIRRYSFSWNLASQSLLLASLSTREPAVLILLLAASVVPPYLELRSRRKPTRVYAIHMSLFLVSLALGEALVFSRPAGEPLAGWMAVPLIIAILIRCGMAPFHCWLTDLFEHATFGTALLFAIPLQGVYAALRLVLPVCPEEILQTLGLISLATALYAAGMSLVQREARRFFCYLLISHVAIILVGLETASAIGITGALCLWLSIGLSLTGLGLTLRALESRHGRLSLVTFQGISAHAPGLAVCFLLTGMASIGFPGTFGFVGTEMVVDGVVQAYPYVGVAIVLVGALNGIAVVKSYFRLFMGSRYNATVPLGLRRHEKFALLLIMGLILIGGIYPQLTVESRFRAAEQVLHSRDPGSSTTATFDSHAPSTASDVR